MIDLAAARETFEGSADFTVGLEEEFALVDPQTLLLVPRFEVLRDAARARPGAVAVDRGRADLVGDRDPLGRRQRRRRRPPPPGRRPPAAVRARARARRRARRDRHAPAERLPRAAHHRHRALPPRRGGAEVRRLAQQHVLRARPRRRPRRRPRGARVRPPAPGAAAAAGAERELAVHRRPRLRPALRPQPDVHEVVPALRHPGRVRLLARVGGLRRAARADRLDRRVHPALVVGAPAPRLRHRRGAHLRRPDDRGGVRRARRADRRLRAPRRRRGRRGRDAARPARAA